MVDRLANKIALVTGAAQGIGLAIAECFIESGAHVVLTDILDQAGEIEALRLGERATYQRLDVRNEADWDRIIASVLDRYSQLDVLVNNAGISGFESGVTAHDPEHAELADWHDVHRTNLDGVFLGCRAAIRAMRPRGCGSIINISSRSGQVGIPGAAAYASSKAAIRNHSKTVALYCAEQGLAIRCNTIFPAAILTPMWEPMLGDGPDREQRIKDFTADCPLARFGQPEEVAAVALMLASDEASYMTGAELVIDGGMLAGTATPDVKIHRET